MSDPTFTTTTTTDNDDSSLIITTNDYTSLNTKTIVTADQSGNALLTTVRYITSDGKYMTITVDKVAETTTTTISTTTGIVISENTVQNVGNETYTMNTSPAANNYCVSSSNATSIGMAFVDGTIGSYITSADADTGTITTTTTTTSASSGTDGGTTVLASTIKDGTSYVQTSANNITSVTSLSTTVDSISIVKEDASSNSTMLSSVTLSAQTDTIESSTTQFASATGVGISASHQTDNTSTSSVNVVSDLTSLGTDVLATATALTTSVVSAPPRAPQLTLVSRTLGSITVQIATQYTTEDSIFAFKLSWTPFFPEHRIRCIDADARTYRISGLEEVTTYTLSAAAASNAQNNPSISSKTAVEPLDVMTLGIPFVTAFSLTQTLATSVKFSVAFINAGGFNIYYSTSATVFDDDANTAMIDSVTFSSSTLSTTMTATVTGLMSSTTYYFRVKPLYIDDTEGSAFFDTQLTTTTMSTTKLTAFVSTETLSSSATFSASFTDAGGFIVYYSTSPITEANIDTANNVLVTSTVATSTATVTVTGLTSGVTYYFRAKPLNMDGSSNTEFFVTELSATMPFAAISNVVLTNGPTSVTASVTYTNAAGFRLYYSTATITDANAAAANKISVPGTNAAVATASTTVTGLTAGTTYYFRARPLNPDGTEHAVFFATQRTTNLPTPNITGFDWPSSTVTTLTTRTTFNNAGGYRLYYSTVSFTDATIASAIGTLTVPSATTSATQTLAVLTGLTSGTKYYVRIRPLYTDGTERPVFFSSELNATLPVAQINNLIQIQGSTLLEKSTSISMKVEYTNVMGFVIYYTNVASITDANIGSASNVTYTVSTTSGVVASGFMNITLMGLTGNTKYYINAKAIDVYGALRPLFSYQQTITTGKSPTLSIFTLSSKQTTSISLFGSFVDAGGFKVYYSTAPITDANVASASVITLSSGTVTASTLNATATGLISGTTYYFRARPLFTDSTERPVFTSEVVVTTMYAEITSFVLGDTMTSTSVSVKIMHVSSRGFQVYYSTAPITNENVSSAGVVDYTPVVSGPETATKTITISGLTTNVLYYFAVKVRDIYDTLSQTFYDTQLTAIPVTTMTLKTATLVGNPATTSLPKSAQLYNYGIKTSEDGSVIMAFTTNSNQRPIFISNDGGSSWFPTPFPGVGGQWLYGVSPNGKILVGLSRTKFSTNPNKVYIYMSFDSGHTWTTVHDNMPIELFRWPSLFNADTNLPGRIGIFGPSNTGAFLFGTANSLSNGYKNHVVLTLDGGLTFRSVASSTRYDGLVHYTASANFARVAYIVSDTTNSGSVRVTDDYGITSTNLASLFPQDGTMCVRCVLSGDGNTLSVNSAMNAFNILYYENGTWIYGKRYDNSASSWTDFTSTTSLRFSASSLPFEVMMNYDGTHIVLYDYNGDNSFYHFSTNRGQSMSFASFLRSLQCNLSDFPNSSKGEPPCFTLTTQYTKNSLNFPAYKFNNFFSMTKPNAYNTTDLAAAAWASSRMSYIYDGIWAMTGFFTQSFMASSLDFSVIYVNHVNAACLRSTDNGRTFYDIFNTNMYGVVPTSVACSDDGQQVFIKDSGSLIGGYMVLWKSTDGGVTFTSLNSFGMSSGVQNGNALRVSADGNVVMMSNKISLNGGTTWVNNPDGGSNVCRTLLSDKSFLTNAHGSATRLDRYTFNAVTNTWTLTKTLITGSTSDLGFNCASRDGQYIYTMTKGNNSTLGVNCAFIYSSDYGNTFTTRTGIQYKAQHLTCSYDGSVVMYTDLNDIYRSTDYGATFVKNEDPSYAAFGTHHRTYYTFTAPDASDKYLIGRSPVDQTMYQYLRVKS
jgi:hypothetical protein